jgi:hypothetical protein
MLTFLQVGQWIEMDYELRAGDSFGRGGLGGEFRMDALLRDMEQKDFRGRLPCLLRPPRAAAHHRGM